MTKLSLIKRLVATSTKSHTKSLLHRHDGPTSDRFQDDDDDDDHDESRDGDSSSRRRYGGEIDANGEDDDSSLVSCETDASDVRGRWKNDKHGSHKNSKNGHKKEKKKEKKKTKTSKNFIMRTINSASHHITSNLPHNLTNTNSGEDDGYESDNSAGSTRSTSSSFLRYQNRSKWKTRLTAGKAKVVLEQRGDGREVPVGTPPDAAAASGAEGEVAKSGGWPLFERIYTRQNQLLKKGEVGEDGRDGSSDEEEEDEEIAETIEIASSPLESPRQEDDDRREEVEIDDDDDNDFDVTYDDATTLPQPWTPNNDNHSALPTDTGIKSPETTQESGIPTCEVPPPNPLAKAPPQLQSLSNNSSNANPTAPENPSKRTISPSKENSSHLANGTRPRTPRKPHRNAIGAKTQDGDILTPLSIPRTICYSLRSAIGDGSARQRHSKSLMERRVLRPNGCHLDCGYWSHRGKRSYMEDRFVIERIGSADRQGEGNEKHKPSDPIAWLGVFDGHGGPTASQFCSDWLSSYVRKNEHFPNDIPMAMKEAFGKLDEDFVSSGHLDGSTACACAVIGSRKVICCNAGDSRAIVVRRDGSFVALSEDHKPGRLDETKRINALGGRVIYWGRWRVEGVLAVSRSIGDARLKPYVTAEPDVMEYDIGENDLFLVIASDGIWDTMTSDLVAKFVLVNTCKIVKKSLKVDDTLLQWIARQVSRRAKENGSSDNVSCIVANLKST